MVKRSLPPVLTGNSFRRVRVRSGNFCSCRKPLRQAG